MAKSTWRADYFGAVEDDHPTRFEIIEAESEHAAAEEAASGMQHNEMRVDVTRTITRK